LAEILKRLLVGNQKYKSNDSVAHIDPNQSTSEFPSDSMKKTQMENILQKMMTLTKTRKPL
jgi:3-deoxy-D-manno-octulosonic acid (KDO) 8-phosphate synthase